MSQRIDVEVTTPDGDCPAVLVTPDGGDPSPAVILFMDAGGVRPSIVEMGGRLADMGYVALVPEMYYRHGAYEPFNFKTAFSDPAERDRIMGMARSVTKAMAASDTGAFLDFLSGRPEVSGTKVGCTGYCMGGGLALAAAAGHPDRIAAAASFHGGNLASEAPDSPHLMADSIKARVYVAAAENDGSFPPEQAERLESALSAAGVDYKLETYPALHGFAVPDNPTYDAEAAERHWRALSDLFASTLA